MSDDRDFTEAREYWLRRLAGDRDRSGLPATLRPSPGPAGRGVLTLTLEEPVRTRLLTITGASVFLRYTAVLAALKACLHGYGAGPAVVVGSPPLRDPERPSEPAGKTASNALPIVDRIEGTMTFRQLLQGVRQTLLAAYERQSYPWESLLADLGRSAGAGPMPEPGPPAGESPLFATALAWEPLHGDLPPLDTDLTLSWKEEGEEIRCRAEYAASRLGEAAVRRFLGHLTGLLGRLLASPDRELRLLLALPSPAERHQLLVEWNDTRVAPPHPFQPERELLHHRVASQAERTPAAVAVVSGDAHLSYGELGRRAGRIARRLRAVGVGADARVGLLTERCLGMVPALLGVLEAGAAYLPLDPSYPADWLALALADSGATVVLAPPHSRNGLDDFGGLVLDLDGASPGEIAAEIVPEIAPAPALDPANLAYVLYTSGSTGRPKGVAIPHRAVVNHLAGIAVDHPMGPGTRCLQKGPLTFDVSVLELYGPLVAGGTVVLAPAAAQQDPAAILHLVREQQIDTLLTVPLLLSLLAAQPDLADCTSLRRILCGADPLPTDLVLRFTSRLPVALTNVYGPTETTVGVSTCRTVGWEGVVPIGSPLGETRFHLLDRDFHPVPLGVPGELHVAGPSLARGYLGRPDLSAERFVPDPFAVAPGERLFRTGDLACHRPEGVLLYLGRREGFVKIRGARVEPGAIESLLRSHPGVREAAVVAVATAGHAAGAGEAGGLDLVAYLVRAAGSEVEPGEVRELLRGRLPEHMVPRGFVFLDALPLTTNGKLDRRALPAPERRDFGLASPFVPPRTPTERELARLWGETLGLSEVGVEDSFFELGGNSMLILALHGRIEAAYPGAFQVADLFSYPTIAALAEQLAAQEKGGVLRGEEREMEILNRLAGGELSEQEAMRLLDTLG
ncbi:MAG TPA: amino acid adenylation domain-containing protein [Thermoanaerobaculia bacterium]|jgi:amino acid adenylation domain-containing protein|nr:amino acid adenylation domain-containing protein [Thermoanaerobaculia bacterium]